MAASETQCAHPIGPIAHILTYRTTTSVAGILPLLPPREEREEGRPAYDCIWSKECCAPLPSPTAVELATSRPRIFSLSPRGTSGERAGERGNLLPTPNANRKQDGPPLPSPLLPRREERENSRSGSGGNFKTRPFCRPGYLRTRIFHNSTWLTHAFINSNLSFA